MFPLTLILVFLTLLLSLVCMYLLVTTWMDPSVSGHKGKWMVLLHLALTLTALLAIGTGNLHGTSRETVGSIQAHGGVEEWKRLANVYSGREDEGYAVMMVSLFALSGIIAVFGLPILLFLDEQDEDAHWSDKLSNAIKYSLVVWLLVGVLHIVGAFIKIVDGSDPWQIALANSYGVGEKMMTFVVGVFTALGMPLLIVYTAYGMVVLPVTLIKSAFTSRSLDGHGTPSVRSDLSIAVSARFRPLNISSDIEVDAKLKRNAEHIRFLTSRYAIANTEMSQADRIRLHEYQREERRLKALKEEQESTSLISSTAPSGWSFLQFPGMLKALWRAFAWLRALIGLLFAALSLLIIAATSISLIDKGKNSPCQIACGYLEVTWNIVNPVNFILVTTAPFFPIDYFIFAIIAGYLAACSLAAISSLGVRLICVTYRVPNNATLMNGLLMSSLFFMLISLTLSVEMLVLAPQFVTFGTQTIIQSVENSADVEVACSLRDIALFDAASKTYQLNMNQCLMNPVSLFLDRMFTTMPTFGAIFYYGTWFFVVSFVLNCVATFCFQSSRSSYESVDRYDTDQL